MNYSQVGLYLLVQRVDAALQRLLLQPRHCRRKGGKARGAPQTQAAVQASMHECWQEHTARREQAHGAAAAARHEAPTRPALPCSWLAGLPAGLLAGLPVGQLADRLACWLACLCLTHCSAWS